MKEKESDLPDLSGITLRDLDDLGDDVVTEGLRRIITELDESAEPVAGFQSAI